MTSLTNPRRNGLCSDTGYRDIRDLHLQTSISYTFQIRRTGSTNLLRQSYHFLPIIRSSLIHYPRTPPIQSTELIIRPQRKVIMNQRRWERILEFVFYHQLSHKRKLQVNGMRG